MVEDTTTLAEKQRPWSETRKCWQRNRNHGRLPGYHGLCVQIIIRKIQTMVSIVETMVYGTLLIFLKQNKFAALHNK